jgi:RHS repeat-associated protein
VEATGTTVGSGTVTSTKQFVWAGGLAEEHDGSNTVTKRFFSQGEQIAGTNYYYTSDHLGSVREMMAGDGKTIAARYSYDPYGRATKVSGSLSCDFQYAGMYAHATSGLNLTKYRAYGPNVGRWISRDPLGEAVGLNLYAYCGDNPVCHTDPSGLCVMDDHPPTAGDPSGPLDPNGNIPNPVPPNTDHPPTSLDPSGPLNANGNSPGAVPPGYANSESGTAGLDTDGAGRSAVGETSHDPSTSAGPHVNGDITPYSAQNQNNGGAIRIPSAPQLILLTIILGLGQPVQYKTMLPSIIITREQSKYLLHWGRLSA